MISPRWPSVFSCIFCVEPAPLDHEVLDHAMENQVVVKPGVDVLQEVLDGDRGLFLSSSMVIFPIEVSRTTTGFLSSAWALTEPGSIRR